MIASSTDRTINSDYIILFQNQFVNCQVFAYPIIKSIYTHWTISDDVEVTTQINYPISMEICRKLRNVTKTCDEVKFISSMNMNEKNESALYFYCRIFYTIVQQQAQSLFFAVFSLAIKESPLRYYSQFLFLPSVLCSLWMVQSFEWMHLYDFQVRCFFRSCSLHKTFLIFRIYSNFTFIWCFYPSEIENTMESQHGKVF